MSNFPAPFPRWRDVAPWLAILFIFIVMAIVLRTQGRLWICASGYVYPWVSDVWSADNSQHLTDPYSFSHVLHGVLFFGLFWCFRQWINGNWRLVLAVALEAVWELFENSAFVINRYREGTAALGYNGDTVLNSVGDLLCCIAGFILAFRLGWWKSLAFFILVELVMVLTIRDSLLLNIIMLLYPIDAIKVWQMGAVHG